MRSVRTARAIALAALSLLGAAGASAQETMPADIVGEYTMQVRWGFMNNLTRWSSLIITEQGGRIESPCPAVFAPETATGEARTYRLLRLNETCGPEGTITLGERDGATIDVVVETTAERFETTVERFEYTFERVSGPGTPSVRPAGSIDILGVEIGPMQDAALQALLPATYSEFDRVRLALANDAETDFLRVVVAAGPARADLPVLGLVRLVLPGSSEPTTFANTRAALIAKYGEVSQVLQRSSTVERLEWIFAPDGAQLLGEEAQQCRLHDRNLDSDIPQSYPSDMTTTKVEVRVHDWRHTYILRPDCGYVVRADIYANYDGTLDRMSVALFDQAALAIDMWARVGPEFAADIRADVDRLLAAATAQPRL